MSITLDEILADAHSIKISDGTNDLSIDASGYLTVNVNGTVTVGATDLDIRDLDSSQDSVEIKTAAGQALAIDGSGYVTANINGDVNVTQGTSPWVVSATDLDIRDLTQTDEITAYQGGSWSVSVTGDVNVTQGTSPWVVSATDLDIRDLSASQDNVAISDGTDTLEVNADGSINVQGTLTTTPGGFASWKVSTASVTSSESQLVATPLSGRLRVLIQNLGTAPVYLRESTGVSSSNGFRLPFRSSYKADLDDGADIYAITAAGTADLRIVEYAA